MSLKVAILGKGRMGQLVHDVLKDHSFTFAGFITENSKPKDVEKMNVDVVIDFSLPHALQEWLPEIVASRSALITGTTGLSTLQQEEILAASNRIAILQATNFSLGISVMNTLTSMTSKQIGSLSSIEIIEKHHDQKIDAPSGTAITLADQIIGGVNNRKMHWHLGAKESGRKDSDQIVMHSLRGGHIVGEHEVLFIMDNEIVSIKHTALNRRIFAEGAVFCTSFIERAKPGLYRIEHVLNKAIYE